MRSHELEVDTIIQPRCLDGAIYSLTVQMFPFGTPQEVVNRAGAKLISERGSSITIKKLRTGANYKALGLDGRVFNCRYGIFDQEFRDRLTIPN